jgi:four helix bundle protein
MDAPRFRVQAFDDVRIVGVITSSQLCKQMSFDYHRLTLYERAKEYDEIATRMLPLIRQHDRDLADHLQRSGNSFLTNLAEGAAEDRPKVKAGSYRVAKREGEECAIACETARRRKYLPAELADQGLGKMDECVRMLATLIRRFDPKKP